MKQVCFNQVESRCSPQNEDAFEMRKRTISPNKYNIGKYGHFYMYVDTETSVTALLTL